MNSYDVEPRTSSTARNRRILVLILLLCLITTALLVLVVMLYLEKDDENEEASIKPTESFVHRKPNILYILADDLGYNDIGYNNPLVKTPSLDGLASQNGRILTQHYMMHVCTPSRHSLLTGINAYKSGMQHFILALPNPHCSPTNIEFLPSKLKRAGYDAHLMGKWHLGFCKQECTPLERGFDTFHGLYRGGEDHWYHRSYAPYPEYYDWRDQTDADLAVNGTHSTDIITARIIETLESRDQRNPFFILMSPSVPHSPLQAPDEFLDMYRNVPNEGRRATLAMISHLDFSIRKVVDVLKATGQYENTIIIFTSDNGGDVTAHHDNSPLRGGKGGLYEGGTRAVGFVHSVLLENVGVHSGMFHVTDWHSTILSLAGLQPEDSLDGLDQAEMIMKGKPSRRQEFIYNINMEMPLLFGQAAVRMGDYKLIWGIEGNNDGWGLDSARTAWTYPPNLIELGVDLENDSYYDPSAEMTSQPSPQEGMRFNTLIGKRMFRANDVNSGKVHLYYIVDDPAEENNLADDPAYTNLVMQMKYKILNHIERDYIKPQKYVTADWMDRAIAVIGDDKSWTYGWCDDLNLDVEIP